MSNKSKKPLRKKEKIPTLILISIVLGGISLYHNWYGDLSDIRLFYSLHFYDGQHLWPYTDKILIGRNYVQHPVEYPALTGLIMWLISFLVTPSDTAAFSYYRITAALQICLFAISTFLISKLSNYRSGLYFVLAPAVLYSLNRNWDIWAIATMLLSIYFFEKRKFQLSAILLAVSIATKFFPLVLMLPIVIIFLQNRQTIMLFKYFLTTFSVWTAINLPFAIIDFDGWAYFYRFSFERSFGSPSIFEVISILLPSVKLNLIHFYVLNFIVLTMLIYFFVKLKSMLTLAATSFFVMFGFILFNKQYSMQYIIWLSALAVISMSYIKNQNQKLLAFTYILWQVFELAFQYAYFQKLLTDAYMNSDTPMTIAVSSTTYACVGIVRYFLAILFTLLLAKFLTSEYRDAKLVNSKTTF